MSHSFANERVLITGATRGLGLSIVKGLVPRGAQVTIIARSQTRTSDAECAGASVISGDATNESLMLAVVADIRPSVLILNAGATPFMAPIDEQTWETFSRIWNNDVRAGFYGIQAALKTPLLPGSRVLLTLSGAALHGAPLSGGLAGAKRELWFMAQYANDVARERQLGIQFQALLPMQMIIETALAQEIAEAYARRQRVSIETLLTSRYGNVTLSADQYGEYVAAILADPKYASAVALGIKGDTGISQLDKSTA